MGTVRRRRQALNSVLMLAGICVWYFCPGLICFFDIQGMYCHQISGISKYIVLLNIWATPGCHALFQVISCMLRLVVSLVPWSLQPPTAAVDWEELIWVAWAKNGEDVMAGKVRFSRPRSQLFRRIHVNDSVHMQSFWGVSSTGIIQISLANAPRFAHSYHRHRWQLNSIVELIWSLAPLYSCDIKCRWVLYHLFFSIS